LFKLGISDSALLQIGFQLTDRFLLDRLIEISKVEELQSTVMSYLELPGVIIGGRFSRAQ